MTEAATNKLRVLFLRIFSLQQSQFSIFILLVPYLVILFDCDGNFALVLDQVPETVPAVGSLAFQV